MELLTLIPHQECAEQGVEPASDSVPRLITSPRATWGGRGPSTSPSHSPFLTVSSPKQKRPTPRITDAPTPTGS